MSDFLKRLMDLLLALVATALLLLPIVLVFLLVRLTSPGPALYWSDRVGRHNRIFRMPKFRSMRIGTPAVATHLLGDPASHLTPVGSFLRRTSLDELPNLINVISGDMRLVGPRPTSFNAYRYKDNHLARLSIYPGMTGLWQISGRSNIDFDQRVELDLSYIAEQSLLLDLKILLKTPFKVFSGHGAS